MNKYTLIIFFLIFSFNFSCSDSYTKKSPEEQKKQEGKINNFLIDSHIIISKIDNTLQYDEDRVKLNKQLRAVSGSTRLTVRKRGALLEDNKILTTLTIYKTLDYSQDTYVPPENPVYVALFDGEEKELISTTLLGSYLSVISVTQSNDSEFVISTLSRQQAIGNFTSEVKNFTIHLEDNRIVVDK